MINLKMLSKSLCGAWLLWLTLIGFISSSTIAFFLANNLTQQILYFGTVLQVIGLLTVAWGVRKLKRLFNKPSMMDNVKVWFQNFLRAFKKPEIVTATGTGVVGGRGHVGTLTPVVISNNPSIEERIIALERGLSRLSKELSESVNSFTNEVKEVRSLVHEVINSSTQKDTEILNTLEEVAVGGIHFDIVGLVWLMLGVVCTSIPKQIADLF